MSTRFEMSFGHSFKIVPAVKTNSLKIMNPLTLKRLSNLTDHYKINLRKNTITMKCEYKIKDIYYGTLNEINL